MLGPAVEKFTWDSARGLNAYLVCSTSPSGASFSTYANIVTVLPSQYPHAKGFEDSCTARMPQ
jgi:hypothetical protein